MPWSKFETVKPLLLVLIIIAGVLISLNAFHLHKISFLISFARLHKRTHQLQKRHKCFSQWKHREVIELRNVWVSFFRLHLSAEKFQRAIRSRKLLYLLMIARVNKRSFDFVSCVDWARRLNRKMSSSPINPNWIIWELASAEPKVFLPFARKVNVVHDRNYKHSYRSQKIKRKVINYIITFLPASCLFLFSAFFSFFFISPPGQRRSFFEKLWRKGKLWHDHDS